MGEQIGPLGSGGPFGAPFDPTRGDAQIQRALNFLGSAVRAAAQGKTTEQTPENRHVSRAGVDTSRFLEGLDNPRLYAQKLVERRQVPSEEDPIVRGMSTPTSMLGWISRGPFLE
jgi:hypothetical protein